MHIFLLSIFIQVLVTKLKMATANIDTLKGKWENIEFPVTLKLISSPNKILLDKTNWNTEFNKAEWKETPTVQLETAEPVSLILRLKSH